MEFTIKSGNPEKQRSACLIVGIFEGRKLSATAQQLDEASQGYISGLLRRGDLEGKTGQYLLLHHVTGTLADRILLIGCGKERELGETQYRQLLQRSIKIVSDTGAMEAASFLTELLIKGRNAPWRIRQAVEATFDALYHFDVLKSKKNTQKRVLKHITFHVPTRRDLVLSQEALRIALAIARGVELTKNLGNLPPNIATPDYLAEKAEALGAQYTDLHVSIVEKQQMQELGMGAFLAVAGGSDKSGKMVVMEYNPSKNSKKDDKLKPIVFIGKGITFDSGGLSLKPAANMMGMKFDMCGAASVLALLTIACELELPLHVIGVMALAENMPSSTAYRPDDVVTSLSGQTIEIGNTDAEGRLVLCDALTYSERFNPSVVIDIATLTGVCVAALGQHASGLFSNHSALAHELIQAGEFSSDRVWQMPLWDEYQSQLDSVVADMNNAPGSEASFITSACFLSRFAKKFRWAHLDVAGTAARMGRDGRATGRPVPLLAQYLLQQCDDKKKDDKKGDGKK